MTQSGQLQRVRHIVLFKLKDDTSAETVRQIERAFVDLRRRIRRFAISSGGRT